MSTDQSVVAPPVNVVRLRRFLTTHIAKLGIVVVGLALIVFTSTQSPVFLTTQNLLNVATQVSVLGILAAGTTLLMVSGGMDLSIGSSVSLSSMILASSMLAGAPVWLAVLACFGVALGVGTTNGILASLSKTHPFVITLGMLTLVQGLALLVSQTPLYGLPAEFLALGRGRLGPIALVVLVCAAVLIAAHILLSRTPYGRWLYAIGGSQPAAFLAGIRIRTVKVTAYALNGALVGLAAVLLTTQIASASATMGAGLELSAIAAVAIGGTSLAGGRGDIVGTVLGVVLLGLINNSLNLMSISPNWQYVLQGAVVVIAVMAQRHSR